MFWGTWVYQRGFHGNYTDLGFFSLGQHRLPMLEMLRQGWSREELAQRTLFTTHTPVPAGHDRFAWSLVREVIGDLLPRMPKTSSATQATPKKVAAAPCRTLPWHCRRRSMPSPI